MTHSQSQRGEGKIGCIVSFLVLAVAIAIGIKAVPVYWNNNEFKDAAKDIAGRASLLNLASMEAQIKTKAKECGIPEALAPGAILVTKGGDNTGGTCTVTLHYSQKIDFYGVSDYTLVTDTKLSVPYFNVN